VILPRRAKKRPPVSTKGPGNFTLRKLSRGDVLFAIEEPADELALIVDGKLEVVFGDETMGTLGRGALCGEASAFLDGEVRTATVRAIDATRALVLGDEGLTLGVDDFLTNS
jgi:CRP-like cAMP-binding protein